MPCAIPCGIKQHHFHTSFEEKHGTVPTMAEVQYTEWPMPQPQHTSPPIANGSGKLTDLHMKRSVPLKLIPYCWEKICSTLAGINNRTIANADVQPASHCMAEKQPNVKQTLQLRTPCMPIFETNRNGKGQLTVPTDYSSTVDDIAMTPAGVYHEEQAYSESSALRPPNAWKRRKEPYKAKQHTHVGGESGGKGCGKNRKEKKRHALRRDILSDNMTFSMDDMLFDCDYWAATHANVMPVHQRSLLAALSSSSSGSLGSFHDALQDIFPVDGVHVRVSLDNVQAVPVACSKTPQTTCPAKQPFAADPAAVSNPIATDREQRKCDNDPQHEEFVVFTEYDVFTTPSASPVRRARPRYLCKPNSWCGNEEESDGCTEDEDKESDYTSDGCTEDDVDGPDPYDDDDSDDDSIVFCEDLDDPHEDSNSSSGFEEKKVRFNPKPEVHVMRVWDFAYRQARKGDWEMAARDRAWFRKRIAELEPLLAPALQPALRDKIYAERFSGQETDAQT